MQVNFKTKNELVYEALRDDILSGKLKPEEKIVISRLAKAFGISGIPIREAIKKLESEGFLSSSFTVHIGKEYFAFHFDDIFQCIRIDFVNEGNIRGSIHPNAYSA